MAPFDGWGSTTTRLRSHMRRQFTFYDKDPINSWYSFDQPRKDDRLN